MRVRCETARYVPGYRPSDPDFKPAAVVYEGEVVGVYYSPKWNQPMFMIHDDVEKRFTSVPVGECVKLP